MKVVIDCNVLVSAARSRGVCGMVIIEAVRRHEIVLSDPIVDEYKTIAERLRHAPYRDRRWCSVLTILMMKSTWPLRWPVMPS